MSQFWHPVSMHGDRAFSHGCFSEYLKDRGVHFRLVPPRRRSKNSLENKHGVIWSVFLKLKTVTPDTASSLLALRTVSITIYLYGNDVMSSFGLAKGFTKPTESNFVR